MFNEDKKEEKKKNCVNINVFAKCKDSEKCEWKKHDSEKKEEACVNINVFAECENEHERDI